MTRGIAVVVVAMLAFARIASADGVPYAAGGATVGLALHDNGTGAVVGGEVSGGFLLVDSDQLAAWQGLTSLARTPWFGGYIDALYDAKLSQARVSFGPEIGYGPIGIDAGIMAQGSHSGLTGRIVLTTSIVAIYARYDHVFNTAGESGFVELGVLLKYPYAFWPSHS
jgi:hypothetical protein